MKISIVTPVFNGARFIEETIKSVLGQSTSAEIQYVVMDGGSTDGTLDILKRYEGRLRWVSGKDKCQSDAVNRGWELCDGDLMAWINADDFYEPGAFERIRVERERYPDAAWFAGYYRMVDQNGKEVRRLHGAAKRSLLRHYSYPLLLAVNILGQPSTFFAREALKTIGPLDTDSPDRMAFDYDLWMRLWKVQAPAVVPEILSNFRWYPESITGSKSSKLFRHELNYALRERRSHPVATFLHRLTYLVIRLGYDRIKW